MKVLVTGSSGQLARSLIERARIWPGIELIAAGRPELDLEIPNSAARVIQRSAPGVIINGAAFTDVDGAEDQPQRALRVNGEAAGEVASAAAAVGAPIIQLSTDYVFDGTADHPYDETAPVRPLNAYGRSKLTGEEAVRSANPEHLILRTAWVYSPFGRNFVRTMFEAAGERDELRVVADQRGSPTSALDLAGALLKVIENWRLGGSAGRGGTYHLAGSGDASWHELAQEVMDFRHRRGLRSARLIPISASDWPMRAVRPRYSVLSNKKFERDFGFSLHDWRQSLPEVVEALAGRR